MNFLKNSIFSRGAGDSSPDWEPENENQMLAVWGSPGSGKTTTAVKLAARLAMQKKDVALLLCDMNTPMLPCICPPGDLDEEHSLGSVLAATHVSESLVRHNCITHKKIRHLTILGMRKGENEYTYPPYERTQAEELLQCLRKIAPYIIVDCGSCIANDILSAIALMEADAVLRLVNCDLKSISYLSSQLPLLKDSQWDAEKQYKVASNVYPNEASEHIERVLGNVAFQIPHSEEVKAQVLEGNLLKELVLKDSKGLEKPWKQSQRRCSDVRGKTQQSRVFCGFSRSCSGRNTTGFWTSSGGDHGNGGFFGWLGWRGGDRRKLPK